MRHLFFHLPRNIVRCFQGRNLLWQLTALVLTFLIVHFGYDWRYFVATRNSVLQSFFFPAVVVGGLLPMFGPPLLLFFGFLARLPRARIVAWMLAQAAVLGLGLSSLYKVFTGRIPPVYTSTLIDTSHGFQFGFLRGGAFWGWPSSHTTIAFAMALACIQFFPTRRWVKYVALCYAMYIGLGISISIHWFSEFVAGAILGSVIGTVVGKSFSEEG